MKHFIAYSWRVDGKKIDICDCGSRIRPADNRVGWKCEGRIIEVLMAACDPDIEDKPCRYCGQQLLPSMLERKCAWREVE